MENLLTVTLEAQDPTRNLYRLYQLIVGKDLLGHWTLTIRHGRIGKHGQLTKYSGTTPDHIKVLLASRIKRRASAPRRIGCAYRVSQLEHVPEIAPADWIDLQLIERSKDG